MACVTLITLISAACWTAWVLTVQYFGPSWRTARTGPAPRSCPFKHFGPVRGRFCSVNLRCFRRPGLLLPSAPKHTRGSPIVFRSARLSEPHTRRGAAGIFTLCSNVAGFEAVLPRWDDKHFGPRRPPYGFFRDFPWVRPPVTPHPP